MSGHQIIAAYDSGTIDAAACWGVAMQHVMSHGGFLLVPAAFLNNWGEETFNAFVATNKLIREMPTFVQHVVDVFSALDQDFVVNPELWKLGSVRLHQVTEVVYNSRSGNVTASQLSDANYILNALVFFDRKTQLSCNYMSAAANNCPNGIIGTAVATELTAGFLFTYKRLVTYPNSVLFSIPINNTFVERAALPPLLTVAGLRSAAYPPLLVGPSSPCSGTVTFPASSSGTTFSDGHGVNGSYAPNSNCEWILSADPNTVTTLRFSLISVERANDWVKVFGTLPGGSPFSTLLGSFTGRLGHSATAGVVLPSIRVAGPIRVTFTSDAALARPWFWSFEEGFTAHYDRSTCASDTDCGGPAGRGTCNIPSGFCACSPGWFGADCSVPDCFGTRVLTANNGTIQSGSGSLYANDRDCYWLVQPSNGEPLRLSFARFAVEDGWDFLEVYDGDTAAPSALLHRLSGSTTPPDLYVPSGRSLLHFTSDSVQRRSGFRFSYTTVAKVGCVSSTDCSGHGSCVKGHCVCELGYFGTSCAEVQCEASNPSITDPIGEITSQASSVSNYQRDASCVWDLRPPARGGNNPIGMNFRFSRADMEGPTGTDQLQVWSTNSSDTTPLAIIKLGSGACLAASECGGAPNMCFKPPSNSNGDSLGSHCVCAPGYLGPDCSLKPHGLHVLAPNGAVQLRFLTDKNNPRDYAGFRVQTVAMYPCPSDCSGNGECYLGVCNCTGGYTGSTCNRPPKPFLRPLTKSTIDYIDVSQLTGQRVVASLGLLTALCLLAFNYRNRQLLYIRLSSPALNNTMLLGAAMACMGALLAGEVSTVACTTQLWLFTIAFTLCFGSLSVKTYRVYRIFANARMKRVKIRNSRLFVGLGAMLLLDVLLLGMITVLNPPGARLTKQPPHVSAAHPDIWFQASTLQWQPAEHTQLMFEFCAVADASGLMYLLLVFKALLLLYTTYLAWTTRNVRLPAMNDSKYIAMAVYNTLLLLLLLAPLYMLLPQTNTHFGLLSFGATALAVGPMVLTFAPKVYTVLYGDPNSETTITQEVELPDVEVKNEHSG